VPQTIASQYDDFVSEISNELRKIDPQLAMQIMYYKRRFTDVEPQVELHIHYKEGVNLDKKKTNLIQNMGFSLLEKANAP
jgi:DNA-binding transcriptional regulator YbjK